jgi:stage V sporulation protein S
LHNSKEISACQTHTHTHTHTHTNTSRYTVKKPIQGEMDSEDFLVKGSSDPFKVAGAIAGRIRDGERIGVLAKGEDAVFKTVESISVARRYMEEEGVDIKFAPKFVDLEDDAGVSSTYVHFAIITRKPRTGGRSST